MVGRKCPYRSVITNIMPLCLSNDYYFEIFPQTLWVPSHSVPMPCLRGSNSLWVVHRIPETLPILLFSSPTNLFLRKPSNISLASRRLQCSKASSSSFSTAMAEAPTAGPTLRDICSGKVPDNILKRCHLRLLFVFFSCALQFVPCINPSKCFIRHPVISNRSVILWSLNLHS